MLLLTFLQTRYTAYSPGRSDEFNSASRSVKPGLIASGIVSAWTCLLNFLTVESSFLTRHTRGRDTSSKLHHRLRLWDQWTVLVWYGYFCFHCYFCFLN